MELNKICGLSAKALKIIKKNGVKAMFKKIINKIKWLIKQKQDHDYDVRFENQYKKKLSMSFISGSENTKRAHFRDVSRNTEPVDIVMCVHNAPESLKECLKSITANTQPPYTLIIIDDNSDVETKNLLIQFSKENINLKIIKNESTSGYTKSLNQGIKVSSASIVVLLNNGTIVPSKWLDRLVECAKSDDKIGIVGPLSNTALWQSVPHLFDKDGDWSDNSLPAGWSVDKYAEEVARVSNRTYPLVGIINGFCFLIKRALIEEVGLMDEITFQKGYGEENDYCIRAVKAGWKLAIADDCYIFHSQSKSYSNEKRLLLSQKAAGLLVEKHGQEVVDSLGSITKHHPLLEFMRKRCESIPNLYENRDLIAKKFKGKRILFLLPARQAGGGGNIILTEAAAMRDMGVDVQIANLKNNRLYFEVNHPENRIPMVYLSDPSDLINYSQDYDAVIATLYLTVFWMKPLLLQPKKPVLGYYMQDYEPDFYLKGTDDYETAKASYSVIPGLHIFTKTLWNKEKLEAETGIKSDVIGLSFNIENFHPRPFYTKNKVVKIAAMVRPSSPRRGPEITMKILKKIKAKYQDKVDITIFGVNDYDPGYLALKRNFKYNCAGELSTEGVSEVIAKTDIFLDCSIFQAMGLTAMEAMACGACVVGPVQGGLKEIIDDNHSGFLVDTLNENEIYGAVSKLIDNEKLRKYISGNALCVAKYSPEITAANIIKNLFGVENSSVL